MQENYLKFLESKCKKFAKKNKVFDIILYGSLVKGKEKPEDIDLLLIFEKESLKKRTEIGQELKEELRKDWEGRGGFNIDIKTINLKEIFEKEFLARQGVLSEGYSLTKGDYFSKNMGFKGEVLFSYNLKNLSHNEKTKFTYALSGRDGKGMLDKVGGESVGRGAILVPTENSIKFEKFLNKWNVNYKQKTLLVSTI